MFFFKDQYKIKLMNYNTKRRKYFRPPACCLFKFGLNIFAKQRTDAGDFISNKTAFISREKN